MATAFKTATDFSSDSNVSKTFRLNLKKVAILLTLAAILGAGVVGCKDKDKTPSNASAPTAQSDATPEAWAASAGKVKAKTPEEVRRSNTPVPNRFDTAYFIRRYVNGMAKFAVGAPGQPTLSLSPPPGIPNAVFEAENKLIAEEAPKDAAITAYTRYLDLNVPTGKMIALGMHAWQRFTELKPEIDKIVAPLFKEKDKDDFAHLSRELVKQMTMEYAKQSWELFSISSSTIGLAPGDMTPDAVAPLLSGWKSKLDSYWKGVDPDAPNLGVVDTANLPFAK